MFSFGKRGQQGQLPAVLQGSKLLTVGLQSTIRSQYIMAAISSFGMIVGAVLTAWLVGFAPLVWNSITFDAPGHRALTVLNWLCQFIGILMGAILGSCFFRHVTYTVVAKSLLRLKDHPDATEEERAWIVYELASMATALKSSLWLTNHVFPIVLVILLWVSVAVFAMTGLTTFTPEIYLMTVRVFVFLLFVIACWLSLYSAPSGLAAFNLDAAASAVSLKLNATVAPSAILRHAKPTDKVLLWLFGLMVVELLLGVATRGFNEYLQTTAQSTAVNAQLVELSAKLDVAKDAQRKEILDSLRASQNFGENRIWAIYSTEADALAEDTPFRSKNCVNFYVIGAGLDELERPWICSVAGEDSLNVLRKIFVKQLEPSAEEVRFLIAGPST